MAICSFSFGTDYVQNPKIDKDVNFQVEISGKKNIEKRTSKAHNNLIKQQANFKYLLFFEILAVVFSIAYFLYQRLKLKSKHKAFELRMNKSIEIINAENQRQNTHIKLISDLNNIIASRLAYIISSIDNIGYGFKIEDKLLKEKLKEISEFSVVSIKEFRDQIRIINLNHGA